jgi:hypothetical protein
LKLADEVDFKPFREEYTTRINKGDPKRLQRVLEFEQTELDEKISAQACMHYAKWTGLCFELAELVSLPHL